MKTSIMEAQEMLNTTVTPKFAYSVEEISAMTSLSKAYLRNEIRAKTLKAKSVGRRVLILDADLQSWLQGKKDWKPFNERTKNERNK